LLFDVEDEPICADRAVAARETRHAVGHAGQAAAGRRVEIPAWQTTGAAIRRRRAAPAVNRAVEAVRESDRLL